MRYPPIGIACFSLVPLGIVLVFRSQRQQSTPTRVVKWLLVLFPIYIASTGPFNMLVMQHIFTESSLPMALAIRIGHVIYRPVDYAMPPGMIGDAYGWYIGEWMKYGLQLTFGPLFELLGEDFPEL
ncbi:hypothetical protein SH528x_007342 [Novipirellula sp. SH528]|uniref:hypothetical protein n=1 Tax=Novipirellula sp. SH528 TaxID=3454466 RepID=UPI003F9F108A